MAARPLSIASFVIILVFSGVTTALQARANGELTEHIGNGVQAALVSFMVGFVLLTIAAIVVPSIRTGLRRIPAAVRDGELAWWALPGGLLGGTFVACQSFATPLVGVALFSVGMIAGQMASSLLVDRSGLSPTGVAAITGRRVVSAGLATLAVLVAVSGELTGADMSIVALVVALFGGSLVAVQQALNGRINVVSRQPMATTWVNFVFGTVGLFVGVMLGVVFLDASVSVPSSGPWWIFMGGILGLIFIATAAWAVPQYGVLLFALVTITGQLTAAVVLDLVVPVGDNGLHWSLVAGVLLTLVAVGLSVRSSSRNMG